MIHQPDYVKELIKKYIEGSITGVELERLKACWKIYEEDELLQMTAGVLCAIGKQEPGDTLEEWEPDFAKIISNAEAIQRGKRILLYGKIAGVACLLLLLVMAANHFIFKKSPGGHTTGGCGDMPFRSEIPRSEFACTIRWGDSTALAVDSGTSALVRQIGDLRIQRETAGVLAVSYLPERMSTDRTGNGFVEVLTTARRQYIIKLPGGVSVHLNAGSSLKLPLVSPVRGTCYIQISGEAHIIAPGKEDCQRLIVETFNSQLQTGEGDFVVSALPGYTCTTLAGGRLVTLSRRSIQSRTIGARGDQIIIKSYDRDYNVIADSVFFKHTSNIPATLVWTKATRDYRDVSLRQFVMDMSRWYGFSVESLNCIPGQLLVNTSICYRASVQEVYSEIRKAGVAVYEKGATISFCNPDKDSTPAYKRLSEKERSSHPHNHIYSIGKIFCYCRKANAGTKSIRQMTKLCTTMYH